MAASKNAAKQAKAAKAPSGDDEKAVPQKLATQGPQSGPYPDEVVIDANAPAPLAALDSRTAAQSKQDAAAQKKLDNEKGEREVQVVATRRGYIGNRLVEPGTVFTIQLGKGQEAPSWVKPAGDAVPTPPAHSSEAKPQPPGEVI